MCGVFGVWNVPKAAEFTVAGLHSMQHRARDFAGIVTTDGDNFYRHADAGLVGEVFADQNNVLKLHGKNAVGHIRYPTVHDDPTRENIQPIVSAYKGMQVAIGHNGNFLNTRELQEAYYPDVSLATSMDTEHVHHLINVAPKQDFLTSLMFALSKLRGSYSMVLLVQDNLVMVRDPSGNRPLSYGRKGSGYVVASETCALDAMKAEHITEVQPGEVVVLSHEGIESFTIPNIGKRAYCVFENVYFSHPASIFNGDSVEQTRIDIGKYLATRVPVLKADTIMPVPDSANFIALGFSMVHPSGTFIPAIVRNHYTGRTFIAKDQLLRDRYVSHKFSYIKRHIEGKCIVLIDDSIIRMTTLPRIVSELWSLGAKEIHVRIGFPPVRFPCWYGIDTPTYNELAASQIDVEEMRLQMSANSLEFISLCGLRSVSDKPDDFCYACVTGEYPI